MRRPATFIGLLAALGAAPAAAPAQGPLPPVTPVPPAQPAPPAPPAPKGGRASLEVKKGMATRRIRYVARGQKLKVVGRVRPFVAGQTAVLEVSRRGRVISRHSARIRRARRGGAAIFRIRSSRRGRFSVRVRHRATAQQGAFRSRWEPLKAVTFRAGEGASGTHVLLLQRRLRRMGFAVPVSGAYGGGHVARGDGLPQDQRHGAQRLRQPAGLRQAVPRPGGLQAALPARRATTWSTTGRARCSR